MPHVVTFGGADANEVSMGITDDKKILMSISYRRVLSDGRLMPICSNLLTAQEAFLIGTSLLELAFSAVTDEKK